MKTEEKKFWIARYAAAGILLLLGFYNNFGQVEEYKLKAIYFAQFYEYVKWPETPAPAANIFVIGYVGDTPVMDHQDIIRKKILLPPPQQLKIIKIKKTEEVDNCQMLFIASDEEDRLDDILRRIADKAVLTVGDTPGYGEKGVLINLYLLENKVKFEINLPAVKRAGLYISSRLYKLARIIN